MKAAQARFPVPSPPPGIVRVGTRNGFTSTYEMQAETGYIIDNNPSSRWARGQLVRNAQPIWSGPAGIGYYMWDRTEPSGWVNNRS